MTASLVGFFTPGSPEWHTARAHGIGGSEVAAVLGLSPWESRFSLWHRKQGRASDVIVNEQMEWGNRLEDAVCQKFSETHPEYHGCTTGTWAHDERPWQIANPDRLLYPPDAGVGALPGALLEAKTARYADGWGADGTDIIPVYYRSQTLWYLDVLALPVAHVAVLIGGSDYREYELGAEPDEQAWIREQVAAFLTSIIRDERPDIDAHSATYTVLREQHPDIDGTDVEIPMPLALAYQDALAAAEQADAQKAQQASLVLDAIGGGRRAVTPLGERIAMRVPGRGTNPPYLKATPTAKTSPTSVRKAATA